MYDTIETHPLISIRSSLTVDEAARLMADCGMGAIGVLGPDHQFIGIFTERDLTNVIGRKLDPTEIRLAEVVNDFPVVVEGPVSYAQAANQMKRSRIRHLIVREGDEHRIVSMRDLFPSENGKHDDEEAADDEIGYLASFGGPRPMHAEEIMTAPAVAVRGDARLEEVAEILSEQNVSGLPVVDVNDEVVGVISERDVAHALGNALVRLAIRRAGPRARWPRRGLDARVTSEIMSTPAVTVSPDTPVTTIAEIMFKEEINRVPVVKGNKLLGVVSRGDVLGAFAGLPHAEIDLRQGTHVVGGSWIPSR